MPQTSPASSSSSSSFAAGENAAGHRRSRIPSAKAHIDRRYRTMVVGAAAEGPSCLFVGPIETASKEMLEALYQQARNSYYNGKPLIVDDMFDKVEVKLRLYGSKSVVKYPRCSLMRQSTYADAEEDPSQVLALATVWILLLTFGSFAFLIPTILTLGIALEDSFKLRFFLSGKKAPMLNNTLLIGLGFSIGYPVASSSGNQCLQ